MEPTEQLIALAVIMVIFIIVVIIEMRILRKRRTSRSKKEPLEDQAFNAILNAKAISNTLARDGTNLSNVNKTLDQADQALRRGDYRGSLNLTDQAKDLMKTVNATSDTVAEPAARDGFVESEPTTKEVLKDKFPENYMESRFSRSLALEAIGKARESGLDVSEADRLLVLCDECESTDDYTQALSYAVQSRKVVEEAFSGVKPKTAGAEQEAQTCSSCGADIHPEDAFCRKCGAKAVVVCEGCGKKPDEGDVFCRSCGTRVKF